MTKWERFKRLFVKKYTPITKMATQVDDKVIQRYIDAGAIFGDAVSYIYMGECAGFSDRLKAWEVAEAAYAALGFRTLPLDEFVDYGGYGKELVNLNVARDEGEAIVFHAAYYRENYLGKTQQVINFEKMMQDGEIQYGNYEMPSTKHLTKD